MKILKIILNYIKKAIPNEVSCRPSVRQHDIYHLELEYFPISKEALNKRYTPKFKELIEHLSYYNNRRIRTTERACRLQHTNSEPFRWLESFYLKYLPITRIVSA